jgi:hypothetical protein
MLVIAPLPGWWMVAFDPSHWSLDFHCGGYTGPLPGFRNPSQNRDQVWCRMEIPRFNLLGARLSNVGAFDPSQRLT